MRGLGLLIFLIVAAIQIISAIAAKRKKEEERRVAMEAAERRRLMMETGISDVTGSPSRPMAAPQSGTSDDVESRRRAQLEQLRQRREAKRQGAPLPPIMAPPTAPRRGLATPTLAPTRPSASHSQPMGSSDQARIRAMEAERRAREQERLRRQEQARAAAEREEVADRAERAAYESQFHSAIGDDDLVHTRQAGVTGAAEKPEAKAVSSGSAIPLAAALRARLRDPAAVREVIVLQEVLHRPVGVR